MIALAADMLRIVAVSEPLYGLSIVLGGVLRGAGDSRTPFLIVLVGVWAVRLPLGPILLVRCGLDLAAIWIAMVADLMLRGVLCQFLSAKSTGLDVRPWYQENRPPKVDRFTCIL